ncbi:IPT/TIG domain-containing protein [Nocardia abscessus]|uniref:IPT/TIG domain-containing protein n=1 Tax=Nocardia abscessus TaxID=120957 RepID=UPI002458ACB5|nr:IPT/TIG domain-containing protein [Nocardia abscessus]
MSVTLTGTVQITIPTGGPCNCVSCPGGAAPTLTTINPGAGPEAGGTTVTLTGTDLTGATAVSFGATPATSFTVDSATQITAVAPAGSGTVQVTVTTASGTSNAVFYSYVPAPALTSVSPSSGSAAGGTTVTLTGTGSDQPPSHHTNRSRGPATASRATPPHSNPPHPSPPPDPPQNGR